MAEAFVELGATGVDKLTDKYFDHAYDFVTRKKPGARVTEIKEQVKPHLSSATAASHPRKQRNRLPSPEGDVDPRGKDFYADRSRRRRRHSSSLERESLTSAQVIDDYESERNDPTRKPESVLSKRDLNQLRRDSKVGSSMSYANGGYAPDRPRSQQPPRSRYDYDDDSDYDERTGRRYKSTGRGYDDRDDYYDREIIETERYNGPPRGDTYRSSRNYANEPYGAGAVTQYNRRSAGDVADYESRRSGRSRSRGRRKSERERSDSDSRSRSRSKDGGIRGKLEENFDTSMRGLGVGLGGALAGAFAAKQFGKDARHRDRDMIIGALVGGLGANAAETKWRDWKDEKERKLDRDEERWEQRYEGRGDIGRSRSAMR